jgi:hypothetical protein
MAKGKGGGKPITPVKDNSGEGRNNGKAKKKHPKMFDPIKRRLVAVK